MRKITINMGNEYLIIDGNHLNYDDSVFSGVATVEDKNKFCNKRANDWLNSELGNYSEFKEEYRKEIAKRWKKAANLPDGRYDFYFNLEDKNKVFEKVVKELAKTYGVKYKLTIK